MTDKPTPTDAELEALLLDKLPASKHYIRPVIEKMVAAMQAAIDKWGQPAQAAEPVCKGVNCSAVRGVGHSTECESEHDSAASTLNTAGNRNPEARYAGYKGQPALPAYTEDQLAAWQEGASARITTAAPQPSPTAQSADSVQEDAALWHWLAEYLVGTRTDLDDEIVACETVNDLRKLVEAAIKQGEKQ